LVAFRREISNCGFTTNDGAKLNAAAARDFFEGAAKLFRRFLFVNRTMQA
jgi:hypothetical protein